MDDFHFLDYLDGSLHCLDSLDGLPSLHTLTAWIFCTDGLHCSDYLDGRLLLAGSLGRTTFSGGIIWMDDFHFLDYLDG
eukprot:11774718-Karenia_brevis.AAC.1